MSWGLWLVRNYHQTKWVWGLVADGQVIFSKVQEARAENVRLGGNSSPVITGGFGERQLPGSQQFLFNIAADIFLGGTGKGEGHM